jgi:outer membrane lipoprotein-sorting protein
MTTVALAVGLLFGTSSMPADEGSPGVATSTQPATDVAAGLEPELERVLDRLEIRGNNIRTLEAELDYLKFDPIMDDRQKNSGVLRYRTETPNPHFFIRFDKRTHNNVVRREKEWHVFDGRWYWEVREKTRQIVKREIVPPGEKTDVFSVGKGQFPLPFGQKKAEILKYFDVKLVKEGKGAPPGFKGDHLQLTPRPETNLARDYTTIDFYVDEKLGLPIRVRTTERKQGNELEITFANVEINPKFNDDAMKLPKETEDYNLTQEALPENPATKEK